MPPLAQVNAVDSEHRRNLTEDPWKKMQVRCYLAPLLARAVFFFFFKGPPPHSPLPLQVLKTQLLPDHPLSRFSTGSIETLLHEPKAKGINIHKEARGGPFFWLLGLFCNQGGVGGRYCYCWGGESRGSRRA